MRDALGYITMDDENKVSDGEDQGELPSKGGFISSVHMIPEDLLQLWTALPYETVVTPVLTKRDIDNLYFAIINTIGAIQAFNQTLVNVTNGKKVEAEETLLISQSNSNAAVTCIKMFFEAVVSNSMAEHKDG